jgi:predicted metalloprotease
VGIGTIALVALLNYALTGTVDVQNLSQQLQQIEQARGASSMQTTGTDTSKYAGNDSYEQFTSTVLGSTNDGWAAAFNGGGRTYVPPKFVLFRNSTQSACGGAYAQVGPHYCPTDSTIYLDETFFDELQSKFGGSTGDVAQAYVIAHEVGHHVQTELGIDKDPIAMELMADCLAGMWAYSIRDQGVFEAGEIKEALDAASAVGDDNIQKRTQGTVNPESWTHGSSAQRVAAFNLGYSSGDFERCAAL